MTSDENLEKLAEGYAEANEDDNHYSGFLAGFRACEKMMAEKPPKKESPKKIAQALVVKWFRDVSIGYLCMEEQQVLEKLIAKAIKDERK